MKKNKKKKLNGIKPMCMRCFPSIKERGIQERKERAKQYGDNWDKGGLGFNEGFLSGYNWAKREFKRRVGTIA